MLKIYPEPIGGASVNLYGTPELAHTAKTTNQHHKA